MGCEQAPAILSSGQSVRQRSKIARGIRERHSRPPRVLKGEQDSKPVSSAGDPGSHRMNSSAASEYAGCSGVTPMSVDGAKCGSVARSQWLLSAQLSLSDEHSDRQVWAMIHARGRHARWLDSAPSGHPVVKYHHTDVGSLGPLPFPVFLEEHKGPDHDVLAASRIGGRGRVDAGGMERPARNRAVGHRVIAFEHRDLGRLLLGKQIFPSGNSQKPTTARSQIRAGKAARKFSPVITPWFRS